MGSPPVAVCEGLYACDILGRGVVIGARRREGGFSGGKWCFGGVGVEGWVVDKEGMGSRAESLECRSVMEWNAWAENRGAVARAALAYR